MSVINTLITDRTQSDVNLSKELSKKHFSSMTAEERAEWLSCLKGSYNASDLNRVGEAVLYVAERFADYGYVVPIVGNKTDWTMYDVPTATQMQNYIANIAALRGTIAVMDTTPPAPQSMEKLDYIKANNIEEILIDLDTLITLMAQTWYFSGELFSGEVEG